MSNLTFKNKVVIVTGASSGIGKTLSEKLLLLHSKVTIVARREDRLIEIKNNAKSSERVLVMSGDISNPEFCKDVIDETVKKFNRIDYIVNNAGISMNASFVESDNTVFKKLMDVNYFGSLYLSKYAIPYLIESKGGILFISSIVGKRGFPTRSGYCASKFAVHGLFESLRCELYNEGVYVGILAPGYTDTEIRNNALNKDAQPEAEKNFTKGDVMSADKVADKIIWAIKNKKRETILTRGGNTMVWINKLFPKLADKLALKVIG